MVMHADQLNTAAGTQSSPQTSTPGAGLFRLQQWLMDLYRLQLAFHDVDGTVCVSHEVASRFALGIGQDYAYIAMPALEVGWANVLPWSHASMREGRSTLYLIAEEPEIDGFSSAPFGLSFVITDAQRAQALQQQDCLGLRSYVKKDGRRQITPSDFSSMPLIVVGETDDVFQAKNKPSFKTGRSRGGF